MTSSTIHTSAPTTRILDKLRNVKPVSSGFLASCPVSGHGKGRGDRNPSLSISESENGNALVKCKIGCSTEDVLQSIGLSMADLFAKKTGEGVSPSRKRFEHSNTTGIVPGSQGNGVRTTFEHGSNSGGFAPALTLQELADAKQLPVDYLRSMGCSDVPYAGGHAVRMVYPNPDGSDGTIRYRVALEKPPNGSG